MQVTATRSMSPAKGLGWNKLVGRIMRVYEDGWRLGRVVSVDGGPRIGLRRIRVARPSYEGDNRWGWNGPEYWVNAREVMAKGAGVMVNGELVAADMFVRQYEHLKGGE